MQMADDARPTSYSSTTYNMQGRKGKERQSKWWIDGTIITPCGSTIWCHRRLTSMNVNMWQLGKWQIVIMSCRDIRYIG